VKDLDHNTVISTTKVFRYLPKGIFDESYYISADADLSSPVLIPEKSFWGTSITWKCGQKQKATSLFYPRHWAFEVLINEGESIITENVKQMGLPLLAITSSSKAVNNSFLSLML